MVVQASLLKNTVDYASSWSNRNTIQPEIKTSKRKKKQLKTKQTYGVHNFKRVYISRNVVFAR